MEPTHTVSLGRSPEPVTESLIKLLLWLHGPPRRTGAMLAEACGFSQQRISFILCRQSRPGPDSELAQLIAVVTQGVVPPEGWLLPFEAQAREERRARAAERGQLYSSEGPHAPPQGRRHIPQLGDFAPMLGMAPPRQDLGEVGALGKRRDRRRRVSLPSASPAAGETVSHDRALAVPGSENAPSVQHDGAQHLAERSALASVDTELLLAELTARLAPPRPVPSTTQGAE